MRNHEVTNTQPLLNEHGELRASGYVSFDIPESDYMDRWTFSSSDGRFEMGFEPVQDWLSPLDMYNCINSR